MNHYLIAFVFLNKRFELSRDPTIRDEVRLSFSTAKKEYLFRMCQPMITASSRTNDTIASYQQKANQRKDFVGNEAYFIMNISNIANSMRAT